LVSAIVLLRVVAVHHVPVVTNHHTLLEEGLVRTSVCVAPSLQVTHVVQLPTASLHYFSIFLELRAIQ
jgi:hypothetical protein